jgi:hypothetical protein
MSGHNLNTNLTPIIMEAAMEQCWKFLKNQGKGVMPNTLYTPPTFRQLWIYFMIRNHQIIFPKGVCRTPRENAFIYAYFYFYCVVSKCGNRALGINEHIKKNLLGHKNKPKPTIVTK